MLITAEKDGKVNTMTAAWGGLGNMWNKDAAYIFIRPQRYTNEFVDSAETFSLTFFERDYRDALSYLGKASGRDENKIEKAGLTTVFCDETPYFDEAKIVLVCKKLYKQMLTPDSFVDKSILDTWYQAEDFHYMYIGEITKIMIKE